MSIEIGYRAKILSKLEAISEENRNMAIVSKYTNNMSAAEEYLLKSECALAIITYMKKCPTANGNAIVSEINRNIQELGGSTTGGMSQYKVTPTDYKKRCEYLELHKIIINIIETEGGLKAAPADTIYHKVVAQMLQTEKSLIKLMPKDNSGVSLQSEIRAQLVQVSEILFYLGGMREITDVLFAHGFEEWLVTKQKELNTLAVDLKKTSEMNLYYNTRAEFLATTKDFLKTVENESKQRLRSF